MKKIIKILFFLLIICQFGYSQNRKFGFLFNISRGYILPHYKATNYILRGNVWKPEMRIVYQTNGDKAWHKHHRFPKIGFGYSYIDFKNEEVLGNANAVFGFINAPVIRKYRMKFNYDFAFGVAYLNKISDPKENPYNFMISSNINAYLHIYSDLKFKLYKSIFLGYGIGFTHYSNGAISYPNLGINVVSFNTSLSYLPNINYSKKEHKNFSEDDKNYSFSVIFSSFWKKEKVPEEMFFLCSSIETSLELKLSNLIRTGVGFDTFYDGSLVKDFEKPDNFKSTDLIFYGFHMSEDIIFGKLSFYIHQGVHIGEPLNYYENYQRYGIKYRFDRLLMIRLGLKVYAGVAQFIEVGLGMHVNFSGNAKE